MKQRPKVKIEAGIKQMHEYFEVDAAKIGELMDSWRMTRREINGFSLWFDAFYFGGACDEVGGYFNPGEHGVHIIAGEVGNMAYLPEHGGFSHIILHELGHYLHAKQEGVGALYADPQRREDIAELHYDRYRHAAGTLVDYAFRSEFLDCRGVHNVYGTWQDLSAPFVFK